jgi:hypothetical protein
LRNLPIVPMNSDGDPLSADEVQRLAQQRNLTFPRTVDVDFSLEGTNLSVRWINTFGGGATTPPKTRAGEKSDLIPLSSVNAWDDFKRFVNALDRKRFVFRGQENSEWRLRTSFHRTGRSNLQRYSTSDMSDLHRALSALTAYPFNLNDPYHFGAFLNLAQHHGYPKPLLDWTWSPYVAAVFFRSAISANPRLPVGKRGFSSLIFVNGTD